MIRPRVVQPWPATSVVNTLVITHYVSQMINHLSQLIDEERGA